MTLALSQSWDSVGQDQSELRKSSKLTFDLSLTYMKQRFLHGQSRSHAMFRDRGPKRKAVGSSKFYDLSGALLQPVRLIAKTAGTLDGSGNCGEKQNKFGYKIVNILFKGSD